MCYFEPKWILRASKPKARITGSNNKKEQNKVFLQFHDLKAISLTKFVLVITSKLNKFSETILQLCGLKFAWDEYYFVSLIPIVPN